MAAIDYGVLVVKDGELDLSLAPDTCAAEFVIPELNGLTFYRTSIRDANWFAREASYEDDGYHYDGEFTEIYLYPELISKRKKVLHWELNGIKFKTKEFFGHLMVTTFRYDGHSYRVIQGYDVGNPRHKKSFWFEKHRKQVLWLLK